MKDRRVDAMQERMHELTKRVIELERAIRIERDIDYMGGTVIGSFNTMTPSYTFTGYPVKEVVEMLLTHLKLELTTTAEVPAKKELVPKGKK